MPSDPTKYWMALSSVRGVRPRTVRILVSRFGSPESVFSAPVIKIARMLRMDLSLAHEIKNAGKRLSGFEKIIPLMSEAGIQALCPDSSDYPRLLRLIEDFPPILYKRGMMFPEDEATVAIVGTRFPTLDGVGAAEELASGLAERGFIVVSGLAKGVDTAAHRGALKSKGRTVAVLGSGLRMIYPAENRQLAHDICVNGALVSECHPSEVVSVQRLIQRNRIISGLSLGVILVEPKRGALNTAQWALRQNRQVFVYTPEDSHALPQLLSETAFRVRGVDELDALGDSLLSAAIKGDQMRLF